MDRDCRRVVVLGCLEDGGKRKGLRVWEGEGRVWRAVFERGVLRVMALGGMVCWVLGRGLEIELFLYCIGRCHHHLTSRNEAA